MNTTITLAAILAINLCPWNGYSQEIPVVNEKSSYTHSTEGFTFEYPQDWNLIDSPNAEVLVALTDDSASALKIRLVEISNSQRKADEIEELGTWTYNWLSEQYPESEIHAMLIVTPHNYRAAHFMYKYEFEGLAISAYRTIFIKGESQYTILQIIDAAREKEYTGEFISMVNSFRWNE